MTKKLPALIPLVLLVLFSSCQTRTARLCTSWTGTPKLDNGYSNPLLDFTFTADPTAVEYDGRLYVYATNDQQQADVYPEKDNSYELIKSISVMSTADMVNWTWHGTIDVEAIAPWILASWAPSIISREEADGKTHFYLYFSDSGRGTGVLTSTSPLGPWTSPLEDDLVSPATAGIGDCPHPFDPGTVIDNDGTAWLAVGGSAKVRIMRLGSDFISIDGAPVVMNAPFQFEANELNFIGGRYVYTYNVDWTEHTPWEYDVEKPTRCCMSYMLSDTPLDTDSWTYQDNYFKNPGEYGLGWGNNHTHLHKFKDHWYLFYHSMHLYPQLGYKGIYRSVCVDEVTVDETAPSISFVTGTKDGVKQLCAVDAFTEHPFSMAAGTKDVQYEATGTPGEMVAKSDTTGSLQVRGVLFNKTASKVKICAEGQGRLEIRCDNPDGDLLAIIDIDSPSGYSLISARLEKKVSSEASLCFIFEGESLKLKSWRFSR